MDVDTNIRRTRVLPVFNWLEAHGGDDWPQRLLSLSDGIKTKILTGRPIAVHVQEEMQVSPTAARLTWMLENWKALAPDDGRRWREIARRVRDTERLNSMLQLLSTGEVKEIPKALEELVLEGPSHADCLIECEHAVVWVEGKRFDWLSPATTWDVTRDQVARNVEAVWTLACPQDKEYFFVICHEHPLKHHEKLLVDGYREGTWAGGWPHISETQRGEFAKRIGTLKWDSIVNAWPAMLELPELADHIRFFSDTAHGEVMA
jgi:hypothetical protein